MTTPSHDEPPRKIPTPPLLVIPATQMGVQATTNFEGTPMVMLQLSNPVAHCNFPMDLEQAQAHADAVSRAILEARGFHVPSPSELLRS